MASPPLRPPLLSFSSKRSPSRRFELGVWRFTTTAWKRASGVGSVSRQADPLGRWRHLGIEELGATSEGREGDRCQPVTVSSDEGDEASSGSPRNLVRSLRLRRRSPPL
jgi:hypothetical protein